MGGPKRHKKDDHNGDLWKKESCFKKIQKTWVVHHISVFIHTGTKIQFWSKNSILKKTLIWILYQNIFFRPLNFGPLWCKLNLWTKRRYLSQCALLFCVSLRKKKTRQILLKNGFQYAIILFHSLFYIVKKYTLSR